MATSAQVDERRHGSFVQERREGDDESARRQRPRGDDVDVLPGVAELDAGLEQRVDEAIALHEPAPGWSQRRIPPKATRPTRSRRSRKRDASVAAARTACSSVP